MQSGIILCQIAHFCQRNAPLRQANPTELLFVGIIAGCWAWILACQMYLGHHYFIESYGMSASLALLLIESIHCSQVFSA